MRSQSAEALSANGQMALRISAAILLELAYIFITRWWLPKVTIQEPELEVLRTGARLASALVYFLMFRNLITSRTPGKVKLVMPVLLAASVVCFLSVPILIGAVNNSNRITEIVFGFTSIAVALREELFYRAVIQRLFESHLGWAAAIVVSNILFVLYHYGAQPFRQDVILDMFLGGCFLGLIYKGTGSLAIAVGIHAGYDAIWSFTPLWGGPYPKALGVYTELMALLACVFWAQQQVRWSAQKKGPE